MIVIGDNNICAHVVIGDAKEWGMIMLLVSIWKYFIVIVKRRAYGDEVTVPLVASDALRDFLIVISTCEKSKKVPQFAQLWYWIGKVVKKL